jgi:hypothetical protein
MPIPVGMTASDRAYVLVLGLAAAAAWQTGVVLLPLLAWALLETASAAPAAARRARP